MNQQLKARLVGAIVLISLAVIFIPMLLDGGERESSPLGERYVPDRPGYHYESLDIPLRSAPAAPLVPRLVDPPAAADEQQARVEPPPAETKPEPAPRAAPSRPAPEPPPAPMASPPAAEQVGWVVQVGSFSRQQNAIGLRDRLRSAGFTSFVDRAEGSAGTIWRVRVGPELERERAERLQQRLQQEQELSGIIISHGS